MKMATSKILLWAAGTMLTALFQAPGSPGDPSPQSDHSSLSNSWSGGKHLSPTGRMAGHAMRASRVMGGEVRDSSGDRIGQIHDMIVSPSSGKIDFAVILIGDSGATGLSSGSNSAKPPGHSGSSPGEGANSSTSYLENGTGLKSSGTLVPVPWSLFQPASVGGAESSSARRHSFTVNVNRTKLEHAPTLGGGEWSEIDESNWRQAVYSYYGIMMDSCAVRDFPSGTGFGATN